MRFCASAPHAGSQLRKTPCLHDERHGEQCGTWEASNEPPPSTLPALNNAGAAAADGMASLEPSPRWVKPWFNASDLASNSLWSTSECAIARRYFSSEGSAESRTMAGLFAICEDASSQGVSFTCTCWSKKRRQHTCVLLTSGNAVRLCRYRHCSPRRSSCRPGCLLRS